MATISNHEKFLQHLESSDHAVWRVAMWLNEQGYNVQVNTHAKAPTHEEWKSYADSGDLAISQRVEVKQLSINFTSADDWPYGDKFIVCAKHSYDRAKPKPFAYIIVNKEGTYAAIVRGITHRQWYTEMRKDSRYANIAQEFYFAPKDCIEYWRLRQ